MRLIHIQNADGPLQLSLRDFIGSEDERPPYAILSHRWRDEEVLFPDMTGDHDVARKKKGYLKLEACCKVALQHDLLYVWCDTCCIDKTSSADLSEAINSMYSYYAKSKLCIAFLDDVEGASEADLDLSCAVWFTRGWTLQELIASPSLQFYSRDWEKLGSKASLCRQIAHFSGISESILNGAALSQVCVSEKMSWAARRNTTRPEDRAYSLMGLFHVHMTPLYVGKLVEKTS